MASTRSITLNIFRRTVYAAAAVITIGCASGRSASVNPDDPAANLVALFPELADDAMPRKSAAEYEENVSDYSGSPMDLFCLARLYLHGNRAPESIPLYSRVIGMYPKTWDAYNERALAYEETKEFSKAESDLSFIISHNPAFPDALYNRGHVYFATRQFDRATADLNIYIRQCPGDYKGYFARGMVFRQLNRYDEAIADLSAALFHSENFVECYRFRAEMLRKAGREDDARKDELKAAEVAKKLKTRKILNREMRARLFNAILFGNTSDADEAIADGVDLMRYYTITEPTTNRISYLSYAAMLGRDSIVEHMLKHGCPADFPDPQNETALSSACVWGHFSTVKLLVKYGADPCRRDDTGDTPLHYAAVTIDDAPYAEVFRYFTSRGTPIDVPNADGTTPLMRSAEAVKFVPALLETLISMGADPKRKNRYGQSVLHFAASKGNYQVLRFFMKYNSGINDQDIYGRTPLISAVRSIQFQPRKEKLLLDAKADHGVFDREGNSALMYAVWKRDIPTIQLLLEYGADPELKNREGTSPLKIAQVNGYTRIEQMFSRKK